MSLATEGSTSRSVPLYLVGRCHSLGQEGALRDRGTWRNQFAGMLEHLYTACLTRRTLLPCRVGREGDAEPTLISVRREDMMLLIRLFDVVVSSDAVCHCVKRR